MATSSDSSDECNYKTGKLDEEKLLASDVITTSQCLPWEVKYHLGLEYTSYNSPIELTGISCEDLMAESVNFCFPVNLIRDLYDLSDFPNPNQVLYYNTKRSISLFELFKKRFRLDHTTATIEEIEIFGQELRSDMVDISKNQEKLRLMRLILHWNKTLEYLKKTDQIERCCEFKATCETNYSCGGAYDDRKETHGVIKGALYEILQYLNIDVLYNGESRVDFTARLNDGKMHTFKVNPDICGYVDILTNGKLQEEIFLIVKVFNSSTVVEKSSLPEKFDESPTESEMSSGTHETNVQEDTHKFAISKTSKNKSRTVAKSTRTENDTEIIRQLRREISSCGPESCCHGNESAQLLGQLALELYGASELNRTKDDMVVGLFIVNEFVYLAKVCGKTLTYARNIWFDMNKPSDRCALLTFLFHLKQIKLGNVF